MTKTEEIKCFCITQEFKTDKGTSAFAGHIYAANFEEAAKLCALFGAKLDGELVETQCANCNQIEVAVRDAWDDEIV